MRALLRFASRAVGGKLRDGRRRELADALEQHDLTEDDLEELKPYVGLAVDCSGLSGAWALASYALFGVIGVLAIYVLWNDGVHVAIPAAIGLGLLYLVYDGWVRLQLWLAARTVRERLATDPRSVLSDGGHEDVLAKWEKRTDLTEVYPGGFVDDGTIETPDSLLSG